MASTGNKYTEENPPLTLLEKPPAEGSKETVGERKRPVGDMFVCFKGDFMLS